MTEEVRAKVALKDLLWAYPRLGFAVAALVFLGVGGILAYVYFGLGQVQEAECRDTCLRKGNDYVFAPPLTGTSQYSTYAPQCRCVPKRSPANTSAAVGSAMPSNTRMNPDPHLLRSALALRAGYAAR